MKTIKVNLVGEFGKTIKPLDKEIKLHLNFDTKSEIYAYILIIGVVVLFSASIGSWLLVGQMTKNIEEKTLRLDQKLNVLRAEETKLAAYSNDLKKEKEIADFKNVVTQQLNSSYYCWSSILKEIAAKIPTDIIVQKIDKLGGFFSLISITCFFLIYVFKKLFSKYTIFYY